MYLRDLIYLVRNKIRDEGYKILDDDQYLSQVILSNVREIQLLTMAFKKTYTITTFTTDGVYELPNDVIEIISVSRAIPPTGYSFGDPALNPRQYQYIHYRKVSYETLQQFLTEIDVTAGHIASNSHLWAYVGGNKIQVYPNPSANEGLVINYNYAINIPRNIDPLTYEIADISDIFANAVVSKTAYDLYNEGKVNYNLLPPNISEVWYFDYQNYLNNLILNKRLRTSAISFMFERENPYF